MNKKEAKKKLKEAKENLELELITQDDYDNLKVELKPIIMGEDSDKKSEELIQGKPQMDRKPMRLHPFHNTHWRLKKIVSLLVILFGICIFIFKPNNPNTDAISYFLNTSSSSSSSYSTSSYKYYCDECGAGFSSQPYQCVMYNCFRDKNGSVIAAMNKYCSCSCGITAMRKKGFNYDCN